MTKGDDHLHQINKGLDQTNIELVGQPGAERTQELHQLPPRGAWPIVVPAILAHTTGTLNQTHATTRETIQLESSRLVEQVKQPLHEGNVRRIVVKQDERTIVEFPLAMGVVGTLLAAPLAALGALAALLNNCTIEVERAEPAATAESPAAEQAVGQPDTGLNNSMLA
jgi:hypothetical protein